MASDFDKALTELYRAPLESFVAERTRLSAELKAAGHKPDATRLSKAGRPPISAWAVNQLWWHAREDFDELLESAAQLRKGKLAASSAHRKALTKLTGRAHKLLSDAGHGSADATLRRISMTLSALAAAGGFEPEPPGTLSKDRDPPGFEAFGIASADEPSPQSEAPQKRHERHEAERGPAQHGKQEREAAAARAAKEREATAARAAKEREAAAAERARFAEERAKKQAKRRELEASVRDAKRELSAAERQAEQAQAALKKAETALAALGDDDRA